jgi:hypothetical protein
VLSISVTLQRPRQGTTVGTSQGTKAEVRSVKPVNARVHHRQASRAEGMCVYEGFPQAEDPRQDRTRKNELLEGTWEANGGGLESS